MKKFYGISIDAEVMEEFKDSCKDLEIPYGPELQRILRIHNKNRLVYGNKAIKTIEEIKIMSDELQGVVNKIKESIK